jgi:hypothetical protein
MATLSITSRYLAFDDFVASNNPLQRSFDWSRVQQGIPVDTPNCELHRIQPLTQIQIFNGTRTLAYDATTQFSLEVLNVAPNRYRLFWTGTGTAPAFRTDRGVNFLTGSTPYTVTVTPQLNNSVALTASAGAIFSNVIPGDVVYVPGLTTGDPASILNTLNEGFWFVINTTSSQLILARAPGVTYTSFAQTVNITSNASIQIFSSSGVQLDDTLALLLGFSPVCLQNYEIVSVTATALEFLSGSTLPNISTIIPGVNSIVVFSNAKSWIALETDQNITISLNGNLASFGVEPFLAGDPCKVGKFELTGTVYSLLITNNSTLPASVRILSAE